jgi:hypothetical protein
LKPVPDFRNSQQFVPGLPTGVSRSVVVGNCVFESEFASQHYFMPYGQCHFIESPVGKDVISLHTQHAVPLVPASTTGSLIVSQQQDLFGSEFGNTVKLGGGCLGLGLSVPSVT